jgi:hypothetical protein
MYLSGFQQKEFTNCFELFESNFIYIVKKSVYKMSKLTTEQFEPYSSPLDYLEKTELLERDFENLIDEIIYALKSRVQYFRADLKEKFILNQFNFFEELYPDTREGMLFEEFVRAMNDDVMYEEQRDLHVFNHAFKQYVNYYLTLGEIIKSDFSYSTGTVAPLLEDEQGIVFNSIEEGLIDELNEYLVNTNDLKSLKIRIFRFFNEGAEITYSPVSIKRRSKSKICKIMGDIWKHYKTEAISFEYLSIYPNLFDCIKPEEINTTQRLADCNIYKYSMGN